MSLFSEAWNYAKLGLGDAIGDGAHEAAGGLDLLGFHGAARTVETGGDRLARDLGGSAGELRLGETDDPRELIHGDAGVVSSAASKLKAFAAGFEEASDGLRRIGTGGGAAGDWQGAAADAFHARFAPEPAKWSAASEAMARASGALETYARAVESAQERARRAIGLWEEGQQVSRQAAGLYSQQVADYHEAVRAYDARLRPGQSPGIGPSQPGPFSDPGEPLRAQARQLLAAGRADRDSAAASASAAIAAAANLAPAQPSLLSQLSGDLSDTLSSGTLAVTSFGGGVLDGVAGLGKFARTVNPLDAWNVTRPVEYTAGMSGTLAGLAGGVLNPGQLVKGIVGSGWGSDPARALGRLVPNVGLTIVTDGGGAAADAGDAASAASDVASQGLPDMTRVGDPVNVATGDVVFAQDDVVLPGALPLTAGRVHRSSWRGGTWLGETWASTFDQRLLVAGDRIAAVFADGRVLFWRRDAAGAAEPVLPESGPRWPLRADADGAFTVTDPRQGLTWRYEPRPGFGAWAEGQGELPLVSVTDRAGHAVSYGYGEDGAPETVTHSGGYRIAVTTAGGRVTELALGGVPLVRYSYDEAGHLAAVVNSSGQPLRFSYDDAGRLTGWTDRAGHSYTYVYDEHGRCVRGESPSGALSAEFSYEPGLTRHTDASGAVTGYGLDPSFRVSRVTDPLGNVTRLERDAHGRVTSRADALGRVTRHAYDEAGNLVTVTRPDGTEARAEYDDRSLPVTVTGPDGATWRQDWDRCGNRTSLTAPDGAVTRYSYDEAGHLAEVTGPDGAVTGVACDPAGLVVSQRDPGGGMTRFERDQFGRIGRVTGPDGSVTVMTWTVEGKPASRTFGDGSSETWTWDADGHLLRHESAAGAVTAYEYGPFDTVSAVSWPDGTRSEFAHDGELRLESVSQAGLTWRYSRDRAGRLTSETDYNGAVTSYSYDAAGQLTAKTNAAGQETRYAYDPLGALAEQRAGDAVTTFGYDGAGRLVRARNDDAGIEFAFDALGRVTAETCDGRSVRTSYDEAGRVTRRVTPSGAATAWGYDTAGRPASMTAGARELRFGYGPSGRETVRELPGGVTLAQDWDPGGRLVSQVLTGPVLAGAGILQRRGYAYSADGFVAGAEDLLAGDRAFGLDAAGRVTGVTGADWAERYAYDQAGNITEAEWPPVPVRAPSGSRSPEAPGPSPEPAGGLPGAWPDPGPPGAREITGTLVTRAGNVRYRHDAAGRVVQRTRTRISRKPQTWRYEWDAENRLVSVTAPDKSVWRYRYDPLGRRVGKEHRDESGAVLTRTRFAWDGSVLAEQAETPGDSGPELVTTFDYRPGTFTPVAQRTGSGAGDASQDEIDERFHAIVTDLTGTPSELVAPDGTLAGHQRHTLWGCTAWDPGGASTPLRFPGQYDDSETGLHYNNQRFYDPATGTYLTPDPLGLAPAPNPHAYVPNPHVQADPVGLEPGTAPDAGRPDNQLVLSGHGGIHPGDGASATVPQGTSIAMYGRHGEGIYNWQGNMIETANPVPVEVYGPGEKLPDYWLLPPKTLNIMGLPKTVTVDTPTRISELLSPNMGKVNWAACRIVHCTLW